MDYKSNLKTIIYDWNGTLLNDVDICVDAMNTLLKQRGLNLLTVIRYKQIFGFPVKDYYQKAGFDFNAEPFEKPAMEFINRYKKLLHKASLFNDVLKCLTICKTAGIQQVILSAMEQNSLEAMLNKHNIYGFFDIVKGLDNHFAEGKTKLAKELINSKKIDTRKAMLIGDTIHDYQVAKLINTKCILVNRGHQSFERLQATNAIVVSSLTSAINLLV